VANSEPEKEGTKISVAAETQKTGWYVPIVKLTFLPLLNKD
jgi:hypothetical protein